MVNIHLDKISVEVIRNVIKRVIEEKKKPIEVAKEFSFEVSIVDFITERFKKFGLIEKWPLAYYEPKTLTLEMEKIIYELMNDNTEYNLKKIQNVLNINRRLLFKWLKELKLTWKVIRSITVEINNAMTVRERGRFRIWYRKFETSKIIFIAHCEFKYHYLSERKSNEERKIVTKQNNSHNWNKITVILAFNNEKIIHHTIFWNMKNTSSVWRDFMEELVQKKSLDHSFGVVVKRNDLLKQDLISVLPCKVTFLPQYSPRCDPSELVFEEIKKNVYLKNEIRGISDFIEEITKSIESVSSETLENAYVITEINVEESDQIEDI